MGTAEDIKDVAELSITLAKARTENNAWSNLMAENIRLREVNAGLRAELRRIARYVDPGRYVESAMEQAIEWLDNPGLLRRYELVNVATGAVTSLTGALKIHQAAIAKAEGARYEDVNAELLADDKLSHHQCCACDNDEGLIRVGDGWFCPDHRGRNCPQWVRAIRLENEDRKADE